MPIFMHLLIRIIIFLMFNFVVGSVVVGFIFLGSIAVVVKSVVFVRIGREKGEEEDGKRKNDEIPTVRSPVVSALSIPLD